ncbi:hypothetical protein HanPI659440_Chr10g0372171 [Helianthus annuus]|nr:hypothetical protein HanPI659440_Chr10g0372171 [Helianthus annuus]
MMAIFDFTGVVLIKMMKKMDVGEEPYMIPGGFMETFKESFKLRRHNCMKCEKKLKMTIEGKKKKAKVEAM